MLRMSEPEIAPETTPALGVPVAFDAPAVAPARRRRWPWLVAICLVIAITAAVTIALWPTSTFTASGTLTLTDSSGLLATLNPDYTLPAKGSPCSSGLGMDDIEAGAQVVVTGSDGHTLAIGELDAGKNDGGDGGAPPLSINHCVFAFSVTDIPSGKGPYAIEVAHRGKINFTETTAKKQPILLTLGG